MDNAERERAPCLRPRLLHHTRKVSHMNSAGCQVILGHHWFGGCQLSLRGRFILTGTHPRERGFSSRKLSLLTWRQR
jgi:hypothetical protein